jgi:hypothetical protein
VIPGGSDEALVGHENCYKLHWPSNRKGFARVAVESGALLIPFMTTNVEESRWNPLHDLWHLLHGWVPYRALVDAKIPFLSTFVYVASEVIWFSSCGFSIPIPVRCTTIFGSPVPYKPEEDLDTIVARCHDHLQALIDLHQPGAAEGRNYARALGERWVEWKQSRPRLTQSVENLTPQAVKSFLQKWARGSGTAAATSASTTAGKRRK